MGWVQEIPYTGTEVKLTTLEGATQDDSAKSLIERMQQAQLVSTEAGRVVPVDEHVVYLTLASEAARRAVRQEEAPVYVLTDRHTALYSHGLRELVDNGATIIVFGGMPPSWPVSQHALPRTRPELLSEKDHLLIIISPRFSLALFGSADMQHPDRPAAFHGGWTVERDDVMRAAQHLAPAVMEEWLPSLDPAPDASQAMCRMGVMLMARQADDIATRQRDVVMDKADLLTVLGILKAISSKRRTHDILFVFVEQVARVIHCNRCSIVRVWGSEDRGRVLASHENPNVIDHGIDLSKYPELQESLRRREKLVLNDVAAHPLTRNIAEDLAKAQISSLVVIPIVLYDETVGSLFLRAARSQGGFSVREISFFEIVAEAASNALERAHLFESIQIANERLERLAITDGLTGLNNHRNFRDRFDQEFERAHRYQLPLSCILFDIDNFKTYNDTYGHLTGDSILREVADQTTDCVRKIDFVARYGGEEFAIVMPQTDRAGATIEGERLRSHIASHNFNGISEDHRLTISVGVGVLDHATMQSPEDLLRATDQALYEAKNTGKNKVIVT